MSRRYRDFKRDLETHERGKASWVHKASSRKYWLNAAKWVSPLVFFSVILGSIAYFDSFLFNNPEIKKQILKDQENYQAYLQSIMENDPWNNASMNNPRFFILSLFLKADPSLKEKLQKILNEIPDDKISILVNLLLSMELSPEQLSQFAVLLETLLEQGLSAQKIIGLVDLLQNMQEAQALAKAEAEMEKEKLQASGNTVQEPISLVDLKQTMIQLLTFDNPEQLNHFLEALVDLPASLYNKVSKLIAKLAVADGEKLISILENLNEVDMRLVITFLSKLPKDALLKIIDRYEVLSSRQIVDVSRILNRLDINTVEKLILYTEDMDTFAFMDTIELIKDLGAGLTRKFLSIAETLSNGFYLEKFVGFIQKHSNRYKEKTLNIAVNFNRDSMKKLINVSQKLNFDLEDEAIDILDDLASPSIQQDLVQEANQLSRANSNKAIDVLNVIGTSSVKKTIKLSKQVKRVSKNQLAEQMFILKQPTAVAGVRGKAEETFTIKTPTAVAGVRGKRGKNKTEDYGTPITETTGLSRTSYKNIDRLKKVIDRLHSYRDKQLTTDILDSGKDISDVSLHKAADVFIDLDINSDRNRAKRLVKSYRRIDKSRRENAIDTLDDISVKHVTAAIDIVDQSTDKLLADSIDYTETLKNRLGKTEGLNTTMRAINLAARVKTNDARQRGLDALKQEREVRVKRILIQTDGHNDIFNGRVIKKITGLYEDLNVKDPRRGPGDRTRSDKLADVLSGSNGLTLGASNEGGISRFVTQERKLFRINQYLSDTPADQEKLDFRVNFITGRPIPVAHPPNDQDNFGVKVPKEVPVP